MRGITEANRKGFIQHIRIANEGIGVRHGVGIITVLQWIDPQNLAQRVIVLTAPLCGRLNAAITMADIDQTIILIA